MHFVIHALDKPDARPKREAVLAEHRAYLQTAPARHGITILISGPLTSDEGAMIGSLFVLDAPDRATVEAMLQDDPIARADVWAGKTISAVNLRQINMDAIGKAV